MDELPAHIGPYEVRDRLGHGGMGVVYLGFDPMLDRPVAIKVLKVPDDETRRRFLREARLAAKVHHPHIVSIYAVGEHEGNPYLAMEFIAGRTMAQVIRAGEQVPLARKVHWLSELCAGLAHAHDSGIVHRDVKPSNLLIAQNSGTLRLVDFGIAHGNEASGMTMAGVIVGTPQYMSPEQITGQPVDARSDIFSVGAVAYELLTGRQAFGGDNLYHVSRQIVGEQPRPVESFVPDVPQTLVKAITRCLQKDPASRGDGAKALEREFLAIARRLDPDHTLVVLPAEPTMLKPARDVTTARREMLREAEQAIEQGELTTASGLLQKLEVGTSPNPDVQQLRHKLQGRRLELRIHEALGKADEASQTGTVEEAEAAINALADVAPRHPELERLRRRLQERLDERQVAALTSRARQALQQDRLEEAESLIAEALALAPDAPDAIAVQQKLSDRTRAQRIARLVAQASRALDQEDAKGARKAIDALLKVDARHRDVARLQARLAAMLTESGEHAARSAPPPPPTPAPEPVSTPVSAAPPRPAQQPTDRPVAPAVARPDTAPVKATLPPPAAPAVEGLLLHHPASGVDDDTPPSPPPARVSGGESRRRLMVAAVVVLLLLVVSLGAYYQFGLVPGTSESDGSGTRSRPPEPGEPPTLSARTGPEARPPASDEPPKLVADGRSAIPATPPPAESGAAETPVPTEPVAAPEPAAASTSPRADPWAAVRLHTNAGRYARALAALNQVRGVPASETAQERDQIVEAARRDALAARRAAEDLRRTTSPEYVAGVSKQAQADRDRLATRPNPAVRGYVEAHGHFQRAMHAAANPTEPAPDAGTTAPPPSNEPAKAARPTVDLSTWSNEEAHASIGQFCGFYLGRDIGGLNRLWPNMDPAWRAEFREAFATEGALVCVLENVTIVRTTDEFNAMVRLVTQLPGRELRRRQLGLTLVPVGDRLVIGNLRAR